MKHNIYINNRDIVSSICINELEFIITQVDFVSDRLMIESYLCGLNRQLDNEQPLKLSKIDIMIPTCKSCNCCNTNRNI